MCEQEQAQRGVPVLLAVRCDACGATFTADFLVPEDATRSERLRVVLDHVNRQEGWLVIGSRDEPASAETFCPSCQAEDVVYDEDDDEGCTHCGGEGLTECDDPVQCTDTQCNGICPCRACDGSGRAEDQVVW